MRIALGVESKKARSVVNRMFTATAVAGAALGCAAMAHGAPVSLHYSDVDQGTRSGFGFSVVHRPINDAGAGDILYRLTLTSIDVLWDEATASLTFTGLQGRLFEENNLDPATLGPEVGKIDLAAVSALSLSATPVIGTDSLSGAGGEFLGGDIAFTMTLFGPDGALGGGDDTLRNFTIRFLSKDYNPLANRFNPADQYSLGLWGATPETFTASGPTADSLAVDIFASAPVVPLPSAAGLGAVGLCCLGLRRRRG